MEKIQKMLKILNKTGHNLLYKPHYGNSQLDMGVYKWAPNCAYGALQSYKKISTIMFVHERLQNGAETPIIFAKNYWQSVPKFSK